METAFLNVIGLVAFSLLIVVTGGVGYLTVVDWRDRRRREQDKRSPKNSRVQKKNR